MCNRDVAGMNRVWVGAKYGCLIPLAMSILFAGCDFGSLLEVELPGQIPVASLDDPGLAETLVQSVVADFECAWDNYVAAAAIHSDEFIHTSSNVENRQWGQRRIPSFQFELGQAQCNQGYGLYTPLQTARFQANSNFDRLEGFATEEVPGKRALQAVVRAYGAYALVALGEGFCEMALDQGPLMQPAEVLARAESQFTEALELAGSSGSTDIRNMSLIGRARVRLNLGDFAGAISDAEGVSQGYLKVAARSGEHSALENSHCQRVNCSGPLGSMQGRVSEGYWNLEWRGVADPRVNVQSTGQIGGVGQQHYFHTKVRTLDADVPIASYKEAQLIIAEAAVRSGDIDRARSIINERHSLVSLPPFDEAGTASHDEVLAHVLEERRRELFAEGGHRLNDMLRFRGTAFEIPFLGEPGSDHPDGLDIVSLPYGNTTCLPLPDVERQTNPNLS
ncbi:MAG: RagB/SusD family nutrient uptake outer membrane protein [Dehalococcoidia bacterium]